MRDDAFVRKFRIFLRLLDGRSRNASDFEDIRIKEEIGRKTLKRDLEALARVPELQMAIYIKGKFIYYRIDALFEKNRPTHKICKRCKEYLSINKFHVDSHNVDGYRSRCAKCINEITRNWRSRTREKLNQYKRAFYRKNRSKILAARREKYKELKELSI